MEKIALVSPFFPEVGGMATQAARLTAGLRTQGIEAIPVAATEKHKWRGRFPLVRTVHNYRRRLRELHALADYVGGVVLCSCSGRSFDLIAWPAIRLCNALGLPVVLSHRGGDTEAWLAGSPRAQRSFRAATERCHGVHVSSPYLERVLSRYGLTCRAVPIIVDMSGVRYRPRPVVPRRILNNRTMSHIHGVELTIRAFAILAGQFPDATLTVTGTGVERPRCERLARRMGVDNRVHFTGATSTKTMTELLSQADLVLNTSVHDNIPNSILEAFASGVPVVTSATGGIPDLIGADERGYLVHERCPEAVARTVRRSMSDPDGTLRKIAMARAWVEEMSWPRLRNAYLEALIAPLVS